MPAARFLNGKYTTTNWDVEELVKRREGVVQKDLFKVTLAEDFAKVEYVE
jgi:hypothetical protein